MAPSTLLSTGIIVLVYLTIAFGGTFLLRVFSGGFPANDLQKSFFRAGHAHAGVLLILGLVCLLLAAASGVGGGWQWAGVGVLVSALLIPGGFFLSVLGRDPQRPSRVIALLWAGVAVLAASLVAVGVSLIVAGVAALS